MTEIASYSDSPWLSFPQVSAEGEQKLILRCSKGDWLLGKDKDDVPLGTLFAVNFKGIEWGWVHWEDKQLVERRLGLIEEGYKPEPRRNLGFTDESLWERDDQGRPKDPWQQTIEIPAREIAGQRREVLMSGSSYGWKGACERLFGEYGKGLKEGKANLTPIIKIGSSHYDHKKWGRTKVPVLELVDWREPGELLAAPVAAKKTKF